MTTQSPGPDHSSAPPTAGPADSHDRQFAIRTAVVALVAIGALAWFGHDLVLPALAAPRTAFFVGAFAVALACLIMAVYVGVSITSRVSRPAASLAAVAEAVAGGDLSAAVPALHSGGEVGRLSDAVRAMIAELRRLATAMRESARET